MLFKSNNDSDFFYGLRAKIQPYGFNDQIRIMSVDQNFHIYFQLLVQGYQINHSPDFC